MRVLSTIIVSLLALSAWAQESDAAKYNFFTDGQNLTWQRVFEAQDSCDVAIFLQNIAAKSNFKNVAQDVPGVITLDFTCEPYETMEDVGYNRMNLPLYAGSGHFTAHAVIQIKPDRYRVTVDSWEVYVRNIGTVRLANTVLKKGTFQKNFLPGAAEVIDYHLGLQFGGLDVPRLDDNW